MPYEGKVLLSYQFDRTGPGYPLYAQYDSLTEMVYFEAHGLTGWHTWLEDNIKTPRQLWDAMMQAKQEHEAAHKERT